MPSSTGPVSGPNRLSSENPSPRTEQDSSDNSQVDPYEERLRMTRDGFTPWGTPTHVDPNMIAVEDPAVRALAGEPVDRDENPECGLTPLNMLGESVGDLVSDVDKAEKTSE